MSAFVLGPVLDLATNYGCLAATRIATFAQAAFDDRMIGRFAFAGVFALLIVWLVMIPAERIDETGERQPWWKNVRVWAILIAGTQLIVYLLWP